MQSVTTARLFVLICFPVLCFEIIWQLAAAQVMTEQGTNPAEGFFSFKFTL